MVMKWFQRLRQIPVRRHVRRLRARWRLHRIEWNGRQRPLEPPPGYEHFYTKEEMFPGLKYHPKRSKSISQFLQRFRLAVRLYIHSFKSDPELIKMEKRLLAKLKKKKHIDGEQEDSFLQELEIKAYEMRDRAGKSFDDVVDEVKIGIKEGRPAAERLVKDRAEVLKKALDEFALGYKEAVSGEMKMPLFFNDDDDDDFDFKLPEDDNLPLRYEVKNDNESHHVATKHDTPIGTSETKTSSS